MSNHFLFSHFLPCVVLRGIDGGVDFVNCFFFFLCAFAFVYACQFVALIVGPNLGKETERFVGVGYLQVFLKGSGYVGASSLGIVGHLVHSLAIVIVLQLPEGFHTLVEIVVDDGKSVATVVKGFPAGECEVLGIVGEIHATLQDIGAAQGRKTVEVE